MPVTVTKDNVEYYLVPAPLVSFSKQIYNNVGRPGFGTEYSATLQGTLIPNLGNPFYGPYQDGDTENADLSTADWTTTREVEDAEITAVSGVDLLEATIRKQEKIRELFTNPVVSGIAKPIKVSIRGWDDGTSPGSGLAFQGIVDDISFDADGMWARPSTYTITIRNASFLYPANEGTFDDNGNENVPSGSVSGYFISSLSENFDIQEDGRTTLSFIDKAGVQNSKEFEKSNKVYTVNRSITAVGSPVYDEDGLYLRNLAPWQQASGFIYEYLQLGSGQLPDSRHAFIDDSGIFASGYTASNFNYQEAIDKEAGTYSLTETYTVYSTGTGISPSYPVIEQVTIDQSIEENERNVFNVQGTIQGLNSEDGFATENNAFNNALAYYSGVIDTGEIPVAYQYARGTLAGSGWLHPKPLSKSVAKDFAAGTISYTYSFDDRPPNFIPGSISESIQINDTYPGEIFSTTPVIGRAQPVLQYLNSRSEYKRSLSINVTMGNPSESYSYQGDIDNIINSTGVMQGDTAEKISYFQDMFLDKKPSITNANEFNIIYQAANPVNDPHFNVANGKCYHSAPTETWDARTRNYTYNIEWTYERL